MKSSKGGFVASGRGAFCVYRRKLSVIWGLLALTTFQGAVVAFNQPARLALHCASLVSEDDLASAVAINSVIFNLAPLLGPMAAGLVIVWSGVAASFAARRRQLCSVF